MAFLDTLSDLLARAAAHVPYPHRFGIREANLAKTIAASTLKTATVTYDFTATGGTVGTQVFAVSLPLGAVVVAVTESVVIQPTSVGSVGTITLGVPTDGALGPTTTADGTVPSVTTTGSPLPKTLTATRFLQVTIATAAVTAGKIVYTVSYS